VHHHDFPTQEIVVNGKTFSVIAPYTEGHVLTPQEAEAFNNLRKENVRNNINALMKRTADEEHRVLTQEDVTKYDLEYSFGSRSRRAAFTDPVTREEQKLTKAAVQRALMKKGFKLKDIPEETLDAHVKTVMAAGRYRAEAERIVQARKELEDLDI
jgi:hypothetical protein